MRKDIPMQPVSSTWISEVGHDPESGKLRFTTANGDLYESENPVPVEHVQAWLNSHSIGAHFTKVLKGQHGHTFWKV
jgi:hypothetical protein